MLLGCSAARQVDLHSRLCRTSGASMDPTVPPRVVLDEGAPASAGAAGPDAGARASHYASEPPAAASVTSKAASEAEPSAPGAAAGGAGTVATAPPRHVAAGGVVIPPDAPWSPDKRFVRLPERLGRGASKQVFRALDCSVSDEHGAPVPVAWNHIDTTEMNAEQRNRTMEEVRMLKKLDHRHVITFLSSWQTPSEVIFVTELAESGTLREFISSKRRPLKLSLARTFSRQILEALLYLHTKFSPPIIHRDLKCENILLDRDRKHVLLSDFGLATVLERKAQLDVVGTPNFIAPELYDGQYDEHVDVYSFGMVLLQMVTARLPYDECEHPTQIYKLVREGVKPRALEDVKSPEVKSFIEWCIGPHTPVTSGSGALDPSAPRRPSAADLLAHPFLAPVLVSVDEDELGGSGSHGGSRAAAEDAAIAASVEASLKELTNEWVDTEKDDTAVTAPTRQSSHRRSETSKSRSHRDPSPRGNGRRRRPRGPSEDGGKTSTRRSTHHPDDSRRKTAPAAGVGVHTGDKPIGSGRSGRGRAQTAIGSGTSVSSHARGGNGDDVVIRFVMRHEDEHGVPVKIEFDYVVGQNRPFDVADELVAARLAKPDERVELARHIHSHVRRFYHVTQPRKLRVVKRDALHKLGRSYAVKAAAGGALPLVPEEGAGARPASKAPVQVVQVSDSIAFRGDDAATEGVVVHRLGEAQESIKQLSAFDRCTSAEVAIKQKQLAETRRIAAEQQQKMARRIKDQEDAIDILKRGDRRRHHSGSTPSSVHSQPSPMSHKARDAPARRVRSGSIGAEPGESVAGQTDTGNATASSSRPTAPSSPGRPAEGGTQLPDSSRPVASSPVAAGVPTGAESARPGRSPSPLPKGTTAPADNPAAVLGASISAPAARQREGSALHDSADVAGIGGPVPSGGDLRRSPTAEARQSPSADGSGEQVPGSEQRTVGELEDMLIGNPHDKGWGIMSFKSERGRDARKPAAGGEHTLAELFGEVNTRTRYSPASVPSGTGAGTIPGGGTTGPSRPGIATTFAAGARPAGTVLPSPPQLVAGPGGAAPAVESRGLPGHLTHTAAHTGSTTPLASPGPLGESAFHGVAVPFAASGVMAPPQNPPAGSMPTGPVAGRYGGSTAPRPPNAAPQ